MYSSHTVGSGSNVQLYEPTASAIHATVLRLNTEELKAVLNDDDKANELIKENQQIRSIEAEKDMILASNKSLAEFNLSREPRLTQAKSRLVETYEKAVTVFSDAESKKKQLEDHSHQNSLDTTLAILQTAAAQSEEESENTAERFLEGSLDVESFLEEFHGKRKLAHLRRVKVDKMLELLNANNRGSVYGNSSTNWESTSLYANRNPPIGMPHPPNYGHRM